MSEWSSRNGAFSSFGGQTTATAQVSNLPLVRAGVTEKMFRAVWRREAASIRVASVMMLSFSLFNRLLSLLLKKQGIGPKQRHERVVSTVVVCDD